MTVLFWLSLLTFFLSCIAAFELLRGNRSITALHDVAAVDGNTLPRVSIIIPARNEQRNIHEAIQALLELDYPDYELIVIDDRSVDNTGRILDEMAAVSAKLQVIHLEQLPLGWLGKNHALWVGSRMASGELLLFTDADIIMEPSTLSRAVTFLKHHNLAHLAATPSMRMPTTFLAMFGAVFVIFFSLFARPWKARDAGSCCHIGIGAFNLVRASTYWSVGGHETIRLRPDDDIKLGKIIKMNGNRQDIVFAPDFLAVEWYASFKEVIKGLEKNAFSGADYNIPLVLCGCLSLLLFSIWPFMAIFLTVGAVRGLYLATVVLILVSYADTVRFHHGKAWHGVAYPLSTALFVYILLRTMLLNLVQGGIYWRGTFYRLRELKSNRV